MWQTALGQQTSKSTRKPRDSCWQSCLTTSVLRRRAVRYMFSYAPNESEASLRMKVQRWLSGHDPDGLDMDPSERQTLFKFYWAASMMPKRSTCFVRMESESCRQELTKWMSREAAADPRFLLDYKTLAPALGLPALAGTGGS